MVEGAFSFLIFLFANPQAAINRQFEGYWRVTVDNTEQAREWYRIYYFDKCRNEEKESYDCKGNYGWAEYEGVYQNLYDKNYLTYGVDKKKDPQTGKRRFILSLETYDFVLNRNKKYLRIYKPDSQELVMEMIRISRSDIRKNRAGASL